MITNEKQYKTAKVQIENLQSSLDNFPSNVVNTQAETRLIELSKQAIEVQLQDLVEEVREYEDLKAGSIVVTEISDLKDLPKSLIKARIANGMTQSDLAARLGLKMQQIQRYEADEYSAASLKTLIRIATELNVSISGDVQIKAIDDPTLIEVKNYPFKQMFKRGWFGNFTGTLNDAIKDSQNLLANLFEQAGSDKLQYSLNRRLMRSNSQPNEYALNAWYARVLTRAKDQRLSVAFEKNLITSEWLRHLAQLSADENSLAKVPQILQAVGIRFIIEPVLDGTLLDGAALLLDKTHPVIALTLRYDRLDNFWFVLFHEIAHVVLHLNSDVDAIFDDIDGKVSVLEKEADDFALDALVPAEAWRTSLARFRPSEKTIINQAKTLGVHPAIIAGRIRRESGKYHQFTELVGQNRVRQQFLFNNF